MGTGLWYSFFETYFLQNLRDENYLADLSEVDSSRGGSKKSRGWSLEHPEKNNFFRNTCKNLFIF